MASNYLRLTLIGKDQSASSTVDQLTRKVRDAGATISGIGQKVSGAGRSLSIGVTAPLTGIAALGVKTEADFSRTMAQVAVATNAPAAKLKGLSNYALEMGAKTTFSAGEAAGAMLNLAKGGFTPAQIKGGALAATMNLAAAGGLDLSDAATDVVASMNTFNLTAGQSGKIADALAGAANASSADVSDLAMALSQGGAAAKATKQSIADTAGFLGLLADNGIRGSDAGTSMKTFLLGLVPNSAAAAKAMRGLGLSFADSQGHIDKLPAVAAKLQAAFKGMGDDERIAAEKQMFGNDAFRAAEALYQAGAGGLAKYSDEARKSGNAQKMAAAGMSGTAGAIEAMRGSLETAALTIGQTLAPQVIQLAHVVTDLANWFSGLDDQSKQTIVTLAAIAAAIGPVLFVSGKLISGVGSTVTAFANARTAATNFGLGLRSAGTAANTGLAGSIGGALGSRLSLFKQGFQNAQVAQSAFSGPLGTLGGKLRVVTDAITGGAAAAGRWAASTAAAGARAAAAAVAAAARVVASLAVQGAAYAAAGARAVASVAAQVAVRGAQLAMAAATGIATAAQWALNVAMTANPIGIIIVAIAALVAGLIWFFTQTKLGQQIWAGFVKFLGDAWNGFVTWIRGAIDAVVGFFARFGPIILAVVAPFIGLPLLIIQNWSKITAWFGRLPGVIGGLLAGAGRWLVDTGGKILAGLLDGAKNGLVGFARWQAGLAATVIGWFAGIGRWLIDTGARLLSGLIDGARNGVVAFARWQAGLAATVIGWFAGIGRWLVSVGRDLVGGLIAGVRDSISGVASAITGIVNGAVDTAKRLLGIASPSKVFRRIGLFLGHGFRDGIDGSADAVASAMSSLIGRVNDISKQAFKGTGLTRSGLVSALERDEKDLVRLAKRRDSLADRLKVAQDRLQDAVKVRNDYGDSVASGATGQGAITQAKGATDADGNTSAVTASDIVAVKQAALASTQTFLDQVRTLQNLGLNDSDYAALVDQFKQSGDTSYAAALIAGGRDAVTAVNTLQAQLASTATQLGTTTSSRLYQAGVDSARAYRDGVQNKITVVDGAMGVVEQQIAASVARLGISTGPLMRSAGQDIAEGLRIGLEDKKDALRGTFDDLGDAMVKSIKKKLKIKSPSGVTRSEIGWNVAEGTRLGILDGIPGIRAAMDNLIPVDTYATPVGFAAAAGSPWGSPGAGAGAGGSSQPLVHIENFHAGGLTPNQVAAAWAWESRWPS